VGLAAVVLAVLIAQLALAGDEPSGESKEIAGLKRHNASLQHQINQLKARFDAGAGAARNKKAKRGPRGRRGPAGPAGPQGPRGPAGAAPGTTPAARVVGGESQAVASGAFTVVAFDQERYDTAAMHDNASESSRLTAPVAGIYEIGASVEWDALDGTVDAIILVKNAGGGPVAGSWLADDSNTLNATNQGHAIGTVASLEAGDFVEVVVFQNSGIGAALRSNGNSLADSFGGVGEYTPEFSMTWLAPGA
jgi:hypothetical protein